MNRAFIDQVVHLAGRSVVRTSRQPASVIAPLTFAGALAGGAGGYFLQWYTAVVDYAINVGGRPLHSWPMFVPVTFELTILGGALAAAWLGWFAFGRRDAG